MNHSNFNLIADEYPKLAKFGQLAERNVFIDPSTSLSKLRLLIEKLTGFIIEFEQEGHLAAYTQHDKLKQLDYKGIIPFEILNLFHNVRKSGNKASHTGEGSAAEAKFMLKQTLKIIKWFYSVYENEELDYVYIDPQPQADDTAKLKDLEAELKLAREEVRNFQEKLSNLSALSQAQKTERKLKASAKISKLDENEAETRERIDLQLREAGWDCDTDTLNFKTHKTLPEKGRNMAIAEWKCGSLWADYALFVGMELFGIVEAKKHIKNISSDLNQAKNYSIAVDGDHGIGFPDHANKDKYRVPFMFATNGRPYLDQRKTASGIWFWDGRKQTNIDRAIPSWFSPEDLKEKLIFDEESGEQKLIRAENDYLKDPSGLALRPYQIEAIEAVEHKILTDHEDRRALLAMATGTGKTRTMIGMCYRLIKAQRFRRILFLVDRTMLGDQAADAFKEVKVENLKTFAKIYDLQDLDSKAPELDTK